MLFDFSRKLVLAKPEKMINSWFLIDNWEKWIIEFDEIGHLETKE